jgi:3-methyl-2-oxobutanoate hydroxymethyltransferase
MIHHARAVVRGTTRALVVADMPFMTYQINAEQALRNAGRLLQETGAGAVKLEGGAAVAETVRRIVEAGIPVMGHLGLTPQSVHQLGGYHVQGKSPEAEARLMDDALALEAAGAFALVLEAVPAGLAKRVTERLRIPTVGIGAGPWTSLVSTTSSCQSTHDATPALPRPSESRPAPMRTTSEPGPSLQPTNRLA